MLDLFDDSDKKFGELDTFLPVMPLDVDHLLGLLEEADAPLSTDNLRVAYIEKRLQALEIGLWSPERRYHVCDELVVLMYDALGSIIQKRGRVSSVSANHFDNLGLDVPKMRYDVINVICSNGVHRYPSNCPELKEYINGESLGEDSSHKPSERTPYITAVVLSNQLKKELDPHLTSALKDDPRVAYFCELWSSKNHPRHIGPTEEMVENAAFTILKCQRPVRTREMITEADSYDSRDLPFLSFALSIRLAATKLFYYHGFGAEVMWGIAPPPSRATNTIDDASLRLGRLRVTLGIRKLLANTAVYERNAPVQFRIKGNFLIHGVFDGRDTIQSGQIAEWMADSDLQPGDKVFLTIDEDGKSLRLYSHYEVQSREVREPPTIVDPAEPPVIELPLRDKVFLVLDQTGAYLHYRQIREMVAEQFSGAESVESIAAVLSSNKHLFARTRHSFWGLVTWEEKAHEIDNTAIILAVRDDDLAYKALSEAQEPIDYEMICKSIAAYFGLPLEKIRSVDFRDAKDARIARLRDGKFALFEWKEQWQGERNFLRSSLEEHDRVMAKIWDLRGKLERLHSSNSKLNGDLGALNKRIESHERVRAELLTRQSRLQVQSRSVNLFLRGKLDIAAIGVMVITLGVSFIIPMLFVVAVIGLSVCALLAVRWRSDKIKRKNAETQLKQIGKTIQEHEARIIRLSDEAQSKRNTIEMIQGEIGTASRELAETEEMSSKTDLSEIRSRLKHIDELLTLLP